MKGEYYILRGEKGLKKVLIEKEIEVSPMHLMIIGEDSKIGKLIKKEIKKRLDKKDTQSRLSKSEVKE